MPDWSWKQAVAECIIDLANRTGSAEFTLGDAYQYQSALQARFPNNRHISDKIRQILQQLRDDGLILFLGQARYALDLEHEDIASDVQPPITRGTVQPRTRLTTRTVRLRDTLLAAEIRRRYGSICQACRQPVRITDTSNYAEGHHLRPLGSPHFGPDQAGNIVILCPNHHIMFDRGAATIEPTSLNISHVCPGVFESSAQLYLEPWHHLNVECLRYHHDTVYLGHAG